MENYYVSTIYYNGKRVDIPTNRVKYIEQLKYQYYKEKDPKKSQLIDEKINLSIKQAISEYENELKPLIEEIQTERDELIELTKKKMKKMSLDTNIDENSRKILSMDFYELQNQDKPKDEIEKNIEYNKNLFLNIIEKERKKKEEKILLFGTMKEKTEYLIYKMNKEIKKKDIF